MKREQFTFYRSYYEAIKQLPAKDRKLAGELFLAVCAYALDGEEPRLSGLPLALFTLIRPTLESGMKQAQKRKQDGALIESVNGTNNVPVPISEQNRSVQNDTSDSVTDRKEREKEGEGEKEKEREVECEKEHECGEGAKPPKPPAAQRRFTPPTVSDVAAYCRERGNAVDAQRFVDFYASKGWRVGNQPMRDWQAAVRNWERRETHAVPGQAPRPADAMQRHSYTQEDYRRMVVDLDAEGGGA